MDTRITQYADDHAEQLVIFRLGAEYYGVGIQAVNTIIRLQEITGVPRTPPFVKGVINLRGTIVPVIDLCVRFGLPSSAITKATRIIVMDHDGYQVGMIVDAVIETMHLPTSQIESLSSLAFSVDAHYLRGVGKDDDHLIILLALDQVLSPPYAETLHERAGDPTLATTPARGW